MMKPSLYGLLCLSLLLTACSKRERTVEDEAEWTDIQALDQKQDTNVTSKGADADKKVSAQPAETRTVDEVYAPLLRRLNEMKTVQRQAGESLITGKKLLLGYEKRFIQMDEDVVIVDDRGTLTADIVMGRFSADNEVELIEAHQNVHVVSGDRDGTAENAIYNVKTQELYLDGGVVVTGAQGSFKADTVTALFGEGNQIKKFTAMGAVEVEEPRGTFKGGTLIASFGDNNQVEFAEAHGGIEVKSDQGDFKAEDIKARFGADNQAEYVEAHGGVTIDREGRHGEAEHATYDIVTGAIQMEGLAKLSEGANNLTAEKIRFWVNGNRRMICEPNVVMEIVSLPGQELAGGLRTSDGGSTEIRASYLIYDEESLMATFSGNVRLRDQQVAMSCGKVHLYLKDQSEIDWIQALSDVIIQSEDRKALGEEARYYIDEGKVELEGNPKIKVGESIMTGDLITFWHESQRMICEPNARVLLYPTDEMRARFMKDLKD